MPSHEEYLAAQRKERNDPEHDRLEDEVAKAREVLDDAKERLDEYREGLAEFQVGDTVDVQLYGKRRHEWRPAIVEQVVTSGLGDATYRIRLKQADGSYSQTVRHNVRAVRARVIE